MIAGKVGDRAFVDSATAKSWGTVEAILPRSVRVRLDSGVCVTVAYVCVAPSAAVTVTDMVEGSRRVEVKPYRWVGMASGVHSCDWNTYYIYEEETDGFTR